MVPYYGDFAEDDTVNIPFNTFTSDDPSASVTITNLADADIKVHKDAHIDQIVTDGASVVIDFDSITGNHMIVIDTSVDAAYATGSEYQVRIEGTTVDGATINAWVGTFSIERAGGALALAKAIKTRVELALPAAAADAAGGLPISDAGGLDIDAKLANTNEVTAARMGALTDLIDGGRLDLILDIIAADTTTDIPAKLLKYVQLLARSDAAIATDNATELTAINADGGSGAGDFSNQTEAVEALKDHIGDGTNLTEAGGDGDHLTEAGGTGNHLTAIDLPNQTMDIVGSITGNLIGDVTGNVDGTVAGVTPEAAGVAPTAAEIKTAMEAAGSDLEMLTIALVNKMITNKASGSVEQFNDAGASLGTIDGAITSDPTTVTRLRMVI